VTVIEEGHDARAAWDDYKRTGRCEVCGRWGPVTRHHVIHRQHVRAKHGDEWDPRNSMIVGDRYGRCACHVRHHAAAQRIPLQKVPAAALEFAVELLGVGGAAAYWTRYYDLESFDAATH
jgi:ribosomal protein S14